MRLRDKLIFLGLILLLILIHRYLFSSKEGFVDGNPEYSALKKKLINDLGPYCKISIFVQDQLKTMLIATSKISNDEAANQVIQTYKGVYTCTDSLAKSRPTCSSPNMSMEYVSCDVYTKLPASSDGSATIALMKITDDLPERLIRESEWFAAIIKQLQETVAMGANPPSTPPSVEDINKFKEGFSGKCSAEAAKEKMAQQLAMEAASCSIPTLNSEIARVNTLLDSSSLKKSVSKMNGLYSSMLKLQSDLEKAKNGDLYEWQKDGPKKSYPKFEGGDRTKSFVFSLQQNR